MRLIDADALPRQTQIFEFNGKRMENEIVNAKSIDNAPTIDAVPVVRCKDCKWWTKQEKSIQGRCALTGTYPTGGWYCGNGERKDDDKSCDTCKHHDKGWDDIVCDGCTKAYSNWERRDDDTD